MKSTSSLPAILEVFQRLPAATLAQIQARSTCSRATIFRCLKQHGYHTSFNRNARYFALLKTPKFDANGLWFYYKIGFSRHGCLSDTIVALITDSPAGYTPHELKTLLRTPVANLLPRLFQLHRLARKPQGRNVVYLSQDSLRQEQQWAERLKINILRQTDLASPKTLPASIALPLLSQLMESPEKSAAQLARALQLRGLTLKPAQIQVFLDSHQIGQKRNVLQLAELFLNIRQSNIRQLHSMGVLPTNAVYTFDQIAENALPDQVLPPIIKTRRREVISLRFGFMSCREVLRQCSKTGVAPSGLEKLAPKGVRYAYDVISYVGMEYYLRGNTLKTIQQHLKQQIPLVTIPISTLYDLARYFLHLFGLLHQNRAQSLAKLLAESGKSVWLLDCTTEHNCPSFFGVLETYHNILLGCSKVTTENPIEVGQGLRQVVERFGKPGLVLCDLSSTMSKVCEQELAGVPQRVCHYHFVRDVGVDLLSKPHERLSKRLQELKLQVRLAEQRQDQASLLRTQVARGETEPLLRRLLAGEMLETKWTEKLGREILLALHFWILDYAKAGKGQGYPFDPHLLYLHRRLVKVSDVMRLLKSQMGGKELIPRSLQGFYERLENYRDDQEIQEASTWYEQAFTVFGELRQSLRLNTESKSPMSDSFTTGPVEQNQMKQDMETLGKQWEINKVKTCEKVKKLYDIVNKHIIKYKDKLFCNGMENLNKSGDRTTNDLERTWRDEKRGLRERTGRKSLRQEMESLPAEAMLVRNLEIAKYREVVAGSLDELPQQLAKIGASGKTGVFRSVRQKPDDTGRLPKSYLRRTNFLDSLLGICPIASEV